MQEKPKLVVLTGAGISAESGIKTFRDADGLWEGHDVMEVATPLGWSKNPDLVLDFYNQRRRQLADVQPNAAHIALEKLESKFDVVIVTQNVDDLHERAGSSHIIHLHGELKKSRSVDNEYAIYDCEGDIQLGDLDENGHQLRPHIVWFGEAVPMLNRAIHHCLGGEIFIIIGTSMQVYPAAGLIAYAEPKSKIYYIDPKPSINNELHHFDNLEVIPQKATIGVVELVDLLLR